MAKQQNNSLFNLIKVLSKSEKRHFKLYVQRNFGEKEIKFLQLFTVLDKQSEFDVLKARKHFSTLTDSAFSNLKSHLYEQILISLRLVKRNEAELKSMELFSFAKILYNKGLYIESLSSLNKAKNISIDLKDKSLHFSIVEMEKRIESLHVTNSEKTRADSLIEEGNITLEGLNDENNWSNLALELYDYYLKFGHIKNKKELQQFENEFYLKQNLLRTPSDPLAIVQKQMAFTWFHFIAQDFLLCYKNAKKWVETLNANPILKTNYPLLYLKGLHNALSALYYCNKPRQFEKLYTEFVSFIKENQAIFNENIMKMVKVYELTHELNLVFLKGEFTSAYNDIDKYDVALLNIGQQLNKHRYFLFQYKLACLCFGAGNYRNCLVYLNRIISEQQTNIRQDVQCFARILHLIALFEKEEDELLDYQIKNTYRFLMKMDDLQKIQVLIIQFLKSNIHKSRKNLRPEFSKLYNEISSFQYEKYETRPLLYLDLPGWLLGKINNSSTELEIQARQKNR
jgi:hypothetical protein